MHNEEMKDAINSFVLGLEEEQKKTAISKEQEDRPKSPTEKSQSKETEKKDIKDIANIIKKIIEMICLEKNVDVQYKKEDFMIEVRSNNLSVAIGKNGKNIDAIEHIINLISKRKNITDKRIVLDINGYRKNHIEQLNKLAVKMAEKAVKEGRKISLRPMPSYERKIIHNLLSTIKEVKTASSNEEPNRRIIIYPVLNSGKQ